MTDFFLKVLDMSLSASWIVLAIITARLVLKRSPKWMICALWALVAVRLLCPFSLESKLSLIPDVKPFSVTQNQPQEKKAYGEILSSDGEVLVRKPLGQKPSAHAAGSAYGEILSSDGEVLVSRELQSDTNLPVFFSALWLSGLSLMLLYATVSYFRIRKKVAVSIELGNGVFLCDYIDTPFILGIVAPKIYLSSAMDPADASHVLAHERAHLKRKDHWWKPLGFLLLSIYWFNPLLWIAYILLCRDIELACDERVVKNMEALEKKAYSEALLKCSVPRHTIVACPLAFGEIGVKQRVKSVLHYKKPGFWILLISIIVILVVAVCFLTDPTEATLSDFYSGDRSDVTEIILKNDISFRLTLCSPKELSNAWEQLERVTYNSTPFRTEASGWLTEDENGRSYHELRFHCKDTVSTLYFYRDFSAVCVANESGVLNHYTVEEPAVLATFFDTCIDPVDRRTVTAEPFAKADEPLKWMHGITMDAIYSARVGYYEKSGPYSASIQHSVTTGTRIQTLLDILNQLPEDAIVSGPSPVYENSTYFYTFQTDAPNSSVSIVDHANHIGAVVRYCKDESGDHLELITFTNPEILSATFISQAYPENAQFWVLQNDALAEFMEELITYPPSIFLINGWWLTVEETPIVVSNDRMQIRMYLYENWEYELAEADISTDSFGIRVRPRGEQGWLYFGCWPKGFDLTIENSVVNHSSGDMYTYERTCYPTSQANEYGNTLSDSIWYYLQPNVPYVYGDYVVVNEDAILNGAENSWLTKYPTEVEMLILGWSSFEPRQSKNGTPLSTLYTAERSHATCIDLVNYTGMTCLSLPEDMALVWNTLDSVRYDSDPLLRESEWDLLDENGEGYYTLRFFHENEIFQNLYFYRDYSAVCFEAEDGTLIHCSVEHPQQLKALFESYIDPVSKRETWGKPFANVDDPQTWLQTVSEESVSTAAVFTKISSTRQRYTISGNRFEKLLTILNQLPETAITKGVFYEKTTSDNLFYGSSADGIAVGIKDPVNGYIAILRYLDGQLTLALHEEMDKIWDGAYKPQNVQLWNMESEELATFMQELITYPAAVTTFAGWEYDWLEESVEISNKEASISMRMLQNWEFEIAEYEEGAASFGIRCRPQERSVGWIYFSYWPEGYEPEEVNRSYWEVGLRNYDGYKSLPQDVNWPYGSSEEDRIWSHIRFDTDSGDFAIINEQADWWFLSCQDEISDLITFLELTGPVQTEHSLPESPTQPLEYRQCDDPQFGPKYIKPDIDADFSTTLGSGWAFDESVSVEEDHTVLFSFWPEYETTGKIIVEYWESAFIPEEYMNTEEIRVYRPSGYYYTGYTGTRPGYSQWKYLWIPKEDGTYVFRMEDTNAWNTVQIDAAVSEIGEMNLG